MKKPTNIDDFMMKARAAGAEVKESENTKTNNLQFNTGVERDGWAFVNCFDHDRFALAKFDSVVEWVDFCRANGIQAAE